MNTATGTYQSTFFIKKGYYVTGKSTSKKILDNYTFGFNGQEKDNEIKGTGNSLNFEARICDTRLGGRFLSLDPLQANYPYQSPYVFAGNNPILNIDEDGKKKTVYWVIQDEATGKTFVKTETSSGLKIHHTYTPSDAFGATDLQTQYWADYTVTNTMKIAKDGKTTFTTETVVSDKIVAETKYIPSETWAKTKSGDFKNDPPDDKGKVKESGRPEGWMLYSKNGGGVDNKWNPSAGKGTVMVDFDALMQALGRANTIATTSQPQSFTDFLSFLNSAAQITNSNQQDDNHISLIKIDNDKRPVDTVCSGCGQSPCINGYNLPKDVRNKNQKVINTIPPSKK